MDKAVRTGCSLKTSHTFGDYAFWNLFMLIPVGTAAAGAFIIGGVSGLLLFLTVFIGLFLATYYTFFCHKCAHYIKSQGTLKCMFLWHFPKLRRAKSGPYTKSELAITFAGLLVMWVFPFYWLYRLPALALFYVVNVAVFIVAIARYECSRCIHAHCPLCSSFPSPAAMPHGKNGEEGGIPGK